MPVRGTGIEPPVPEWVDVNQRLYRSFAFIDITGFTTYTDRHGTDAAIELLNRFRSACRDVTGRRGVRVAKWLGDGVMLVGTEAGPLIAAVGELALRLHDDEFDIHAGIADGTVLLFEGDDYVGRPVNLAARLCEAAGPGEALCVGMDDSIPDWIEVSGPGDGSCHGHRRPHRRVAAARRRTTRGPSDRPSSTTRRCPGNPRTSRSPKTKTRPTSTRPRWPSSSSRRDGAGVACPLRFVGCAASVSPPGSVPGGWSFVWATRIRNALGDATMIDRALAGALTLSSLSIAAAVALAWIGWRGRGLVVGTGDRRRARRRVARAGHADRPRRPSRGLHRRARDVGRDLDRSVRVGVASRPVVSSRDSGRTGRHRYHRRRYGTARDRHREARATRRRGPLRAEPVAHRHRARDLPCRRRHRG